MSKISTIKQVAANPSQSSAQEDFWLLCPSEVSNDSLAEAVHALYYLPANYKIIVLSGALSRNVTSMAEGSIMKRVRFEPGTGLSNGTSPFSFAGAVVYGSADAEAIKGATPTVIVSQGASKDIETNGHKGFTVSAGNPEAFASAVLRIARAAV
jgi:hypothetical protein